MSRGWPRGRGFGGFGGRPWVRFRQNGAIEVFEKTCPHTCWKCGVITMSDDPHRMRRTMLPTIQGVTASRRHSAQPRRRPSTLIVALVRGVPECRRDAITPWIAGTSWVITSTTLIPFSITLIPPPLRWEVKAFQHSILLPSTDIPLILSLLRLRSRRAGEDDSTWNCHIQRALLLRAGGSGDISRWCSEERA